MQIHLFRFLSSEFHPRSQFRVSSMSGAYLMSRTSWFVFLLSASPLIAADAPVRVIVWDEQQPAQKTVYENFLGNAIADYLKSRPGLQVSSVNQNDPQQGLSEQTLDQCDVLVWWGHV